MTLKIFTQPNCPKCPAAKALARQFKIDPSSTGRGRENLKFKIEEYDTSNSNGLAEASFYSVMATPSLILCDDNGEEIWGW